MSASHVALLRGINVGGSGLLAMKELANLCTAAGLRSVRTYIQSGNVIFDSDQPEAAIRFRLEPVLHARVGKPVDVMIRTAEEMRSVLRDNPFPDKEPAKVAIAFLHQPPPMDLMEHVVAPGGEQVQLGTREVYLFYPEGMGRSKLKLPLKDTAATVRNMNTVAKLVAMCER